MEFEFVETEIFTRRVLEILEDEEYSLLQADLIRNPKSGDLIPGGKGLRKLRWSADGKGKRSGARVIYYLYLSERQIFMVYVFKKSDQVDLSRDQLRMLAEYLKRKGGVL